MGLTQIDLPCGSEPEIPLWLHRMYERCRCLIVPSRESQMENVSEAAILLNVYTPRILIIFSRPQAALPPTRIFLKYNV